MAASRPGYIVAFEGPEDIVSPQFDLLPEAPSILKIGSMNQRIAEHKNRLARYRSSASVGQFVWGVDCIIKSRFKKAEEFITAGAPGELRLVFMQGGAVGASRACTDAIKKYITSVGGDITRAEAYLAKVAKDGVHGLDLSRHPDLSRRHYSKTDDPMTQAMGAAEELDARTASLQPQTAYHFRHNVTTVQGPRDEGNGVATQSPATVGATTTSLTQPQSRFSSWSSPSDGHSSGHISTAQELSFQQPRLIPIALSSSDTLAYKEGETPDVSVGSNGKAKPSGAVHEARRQEALMLLEGNIEPDTGYDPILPMREDLVLLLQEETSSTSLDELAAAYRSGHLHVDDARDPSKPVQDRFLALFTTDQPTLIELQNSVRAELQRWFANHTPTLDLSIFAPVLDRSSLSESSQMALASIEEGTDLLLAVGCQEGVDKETVEWVVKKLSRLGKPDGKSYSRTGRMQFKKLLTEVMLAHTSQPLVKQTDNNPFETPSTTAEAVLPYIADHLTMNSSGRFLIIDFAQRHVPAILALRALLGRKMFKIAAITREEEREATPWPRAPDPVTSSIASPIPTDPNLSPLASSPPARPPFTEADWKVEVLTAAEATEILNLTTKVWRALREADEWYNAGAEDKVDESGNRISIAVTTEGPTLAPAVKRLISIAKRPEGYEQGKSNFSRPLVPVSPPESIPASSDSPAISSGEHTAAPASPGPTIGSSASGSSGSTWKTLTQRLKRSGTPSIGGADGESGSSTNRLAKKLSALFSPKPPPQTEHPARGGRTSSPAVAPTPEAPALPPPPPQHTPGTTPARPNAQVTGPDNTDDPEHDEDTDEEELRLLGRFGTSWYGDEEDDDKARRMLGLP